MAQIKKELKENTLYLVKNGELKEIKAPDTGYGKWEANWQDGKLLDIVTSARMRLDKLR